MKSKKRIVPLLVLGLVLALAVGCAVYLLTYYRAAPGALEILELPAEGVTVERLKGGDLAFVPEAPRAGLIFYPGGKVDERSYAPLMQALAERGILCVVTKMPAHLAVLDPNAADGLRERWPQIEDWYLGGHSLGGVVASIYLEKHPAEYRGLILLASYSTKDLSGTGLRVLSVYGSEDGVLKRAEYRKALANLPQDRTELVIEGGCHAGFGDYGAQRGDGTPTISRQEQIRRTAEAVADFLFAAEEQQQAA